jgi:SnoaL-like domain
MTAPRLRSIFALAGIVLSQAECTLTSTSLPASHSAAIQDSVRSALATYQRYSAAGQWDSLLTLYTSDSTFRWIEDGRRGGGAALRTALASLPAGVRVATTYDSMEIVALSPGVAALTTYYRTEFLGYPTPVRFSGAISMVWAHEAAGWRIRSGHSSSATPHADR